MTKIQIRKQQILVIGIFLFLLLAGILGSYFVLHRSIPHRVVVISQDGKEVQRIAMDTVKNPHLIEITGEDGAWNRVWILRHIPADFSRKSGYGTIPYQMGHALCSHRYSR